MYALVTDGTIQQTGGLPGSARLLSTGDWLCPPGGLIEATQAQRESCGWFAVVDVTPAFNQATQTVDRGAVELVAGVPTVKYTVRALNAEETAARVAAANEQTIRDRATQALAANATFMALASPTNAQTLAQVKALTKQLNGLIRLTVRALDTIADS